MTLYLALDTATDLGSVAVGTADSALAEVLVGARRHAAALAPAVTEVLQLAGAGVRDLAGIIVADGPGSFTGLRIGFATAQGIARAQNGLTVLTAPSLIGAARAASSYAGGPVAAIYNALRGEVFAAVYDFGGPSLVLMPPRLTTLKALAGEGLPATLAVGDGAILDPPLMRSWTGRDPVGPPDGAPRASALLALMAVPGALRSVGNIAAFEPEYGRAAEAQVRWERTHGRPLPGSTSHAG